MLASCYLQLFIRKHNQNQTTNYSWYTVPTILSTVSVLLIFFFGSCFEKDWISILPLVRVCILYYLYANSSITFGQLDGANRSFS